MLEFGSTNCRSCIIMGQTLYKLKQKYPQSNVYFIDIYKDEQAAMKYGAVMIPAQIYLDKTAKSLTNILEKSNIVNLRSKLKSF